MELIEEIREQARLGILHTLPPRKALVVASSLLAKIPALCDDNKAKDRKIERLREALAEIEGMGDKTMNWALIPIGGVPSIAHAIGRNQAFAEVAEMACAALKGH